MLAMASKQRITISPDWPANTGWRDGARLKIVVGVVVPDPLQSS